MFAMKLYSLLPPTHMCYHSCSHGWGLTACERIRYTSSPCSLNITPGLALVSNCVPCGAAHVSLPRLSLFRPPSHARRRPNRGQYSFYSDPIFNEGKEGPCCTPHHPAGRFGSHITGSVGAAHWVLRAWYVRRSQPPFQ